MEIGPKTWLTSMILKVKTHDISWNVISGISLFQKNFQKKLDQTSVYIVKVHIWYCIMQYSGPVF